LRRALAISQGDPTVLVGSPVAIVLLAIAALALLGPLLWRLLRPAGAPASLASDTD
jgi:putative tricarboxylic transport membrane protein